MLVSAPFFTIGIPVYNTSKFLRECLDSILGQSFSNFEVVCVDDGSSDSSLEILKEYAAKDNRIRIFSRSNCGVSATRNAIIQYAHGKYLYYIDSDDIVCEDAFRHAYDEIEKNNYPDILQTSCVKILYGERFDLKVMDISAYFTTDMNPDDRPLRMWFDGAFKPFSASRFVNVDFLRLYGLHFNTAYSAGEDNDFSFRLFRRARTAVSADFNSFIYLCPREGSATINLSNKTINSIIRHRIDFFNELRYWNLSEDVRHKIENKKIEFYADRRDFLLTVFDKKSRSDILEIADMTEQLIGREIKKLPLPKGQSGVICLMFRIIGIKNTINLLYSYLKLKGIVKE